MEHILTKIARFEAFAEAGVAPIEDFGHDFNRILASHPPEEARRLKRKFRKLWRTAAKKEKGHARRCGLGAEEPTKSQKRNRKLLVLTKVSKAAREKERTYRLGAST